jgi:hypothetical protein
MKDVLKSVTWPGALVILGVLALVGFMFYRGETVSALVAAMVALMGWQGQQRATDSQRLGTIEQQTNGVNHGLQQQLAEANERAAAIARESAERLAQLQREMAEQRNVDMRIMAQLAAQLPMGSPLPPALTDGTAPVSSPPALAYANGSTAPLPRTPGDNL